MSSYLDDKGRRILAAQDKVSEHTGASLAEIALAWVNAQEVWGRQSLLPRRSNNCGALRVERG